MKKLKIVLIGAGSASFGRGAIADVFACEELRQFDLTLALVDVNPDTLDMMAKFAHRLREHYGVAAEIEASVERNDMLPGADYVIVSVARDRWSMWEKDFYIPASYGFKHVFGENGGPGGAFHTLRSLHLVIPISQDVEKICPKALLLNYTNPESRICLGIDKLTRVKCIGLCHGAFFTLRRIAEVLERPKEEVDITIGGINHFHWALKIEETGTGRDLKPEFDRRMQASDCGFDPFIRQLYETFGYLTYPATSHPGEYVSFAYDIAGPVFTNWGIGGVSRRPSDTATDCNYTSEGMPSCSYDLWAVEHAKHIANVAAGKAPLTDELTAPTGELAVPIMCDIELNRGSRELSVNVPNTGNAISNLPEDAIVEVPALVDREGVKPVNIGPLPEAIAALCRKQISIQNLLVESYAERSKQCLLQALVLDPIVDSVDRAKRMMEHMLRLQADYLPELT